MLRKQGRRILLWLIGVACLSLLVFVFPKHLDQILLYGDSMIFWAPGQLIVHGDNPYNEDLLVAKLNEAGRSPDKSDPLSFPMMVYPPWVFLVLIPLGWLDYPIFRVIWIVFHLLLIFLSADMVWSLYFKVPEKRWLAWLITLTFAPIVRAVSVGNISPVVLFGLVAFLVFISQKPLKLKNDLLAGAAILLITIKPQLLYLFLAVLGVWVIVNKRWFVLIGAGLAILLGTAFATIFNPQVAINYLNAMQTFPFYAYQTPTIGAILRMVFSPEAFWLQFAPVLLGLSWGIIYFFTHQNTWTWMHHAPVVVIISLLTAPFAWTYDLVFLILPLILVIGQLFTDHVPLTHTSIICASIIMVNLLVYIFYAQTHDFWLFWLTPAFTLWYLCSQFWIDSSSRSRLQSASGGT